MNKVFSYIIAAIFLAVTVIIAAQKPEIHKPVKIDEQIQKQELQESKETQLEWNVWHSKVLNKLMTLAKNSPDNQPLGTINYIEFDVDTNQNITNIKIYTEPEMYSQSSRKYFAEFVRSLNGDDVLKFPKDSQRKITHFKAALKKADKTEYSRPEDFADVETIKKQR